MPRGARASAVQIIRYRGARCGGAGAGREGKTARAIILQQSNQGTGCCLRLALRANVKQGEETKGSGRTIIRKKSELMVCCG